MKTLIRLRICAPMSEGTFSHVTLKMLMITPTDMKIFSLQHASR